MITTEHLYRILGRIATGSYTPDDITELARVLTVADQDHLQLGKYNVHITKGEDLQIGDRIYQGLDADTIQRFLDEILSAIENRHGRKSSEPTWSEIRKWYLERLEGH